jgi:hypothetical protein
LIASNLCSTFRTYSIAFERIISALIRHWFWTSHIHLSAQHCKKHFRDCTRLREAVNEFSSLQDNKKALSNHFSNPKNTDLLHMQ